MIAGIIALLLQASPAAAEEVGNWQVWQTRDPITDATRAGAAIIIADGSLAVKCDTPGINSVYVSFSGDQFFGAGRSTVNRRPVIFRVGDGPPQETLWLYSDDDHVLLTRDVSRFTGPLLDADRVTIRAMTYRFQDVTRTFELSGTREAITKVYEACGDRIY